MNTKIKNILLVAAALTAAFIIIKKNNKASGLKARLRMQ